MFTTEEKVLILGSLFHDIGKFVQRCNPKAQYRKHTIEGKLFLEENMQINDYLKDILGSEENLKSFYDIILNHHRPFNEFEKIVQAADQLSASEREMLEECEEDPESKWQNKHLTSVFSKIRLLSEKEVPARYFNHKYLIDKNYEELIPASESQDTLYSYDSEDLKSFRNDLEQILSFYESDEDFSTIVNLTLILFEKYLWCIPDFTGNPQTDISLYNHSKDVSGLSLAMLKSTPGSKKLNLVIGDIPGIQDYIFDLYSSKRVAKTLRGRSIFVQVLSRNFATEFLDNLGLTECNLVMLAGGKFYIIAQSSENFEEDFQRTRATIEAFLWEHFNAELSFNTSYAEFDFEELKENKITFGSIVEKANEQLLKNRKKVFSHLLFSDGKVEERNFVFGHKFISPDENDSNNIKCKLTNKPIPEGRAKHIEGVGSVLEQAHLENSIGEEVPDDNVLVEIREDGLSVESVFPIKDYKGQRTARKILINPDLETILSVVREKPTGKLNFLRNTRVIEVAGFVRKNEDDMSREEREKFEDDFPNSVMTFARLAEQGKGINYLALIKGDIDNLGMIMALGLDRDDKSLSALSRTTTMSHHLKYFFSFYLNNFLKEHHPNTYTVFAGGDDLLLITPQSQAVALVDSLNKKLEAFACYNDEIHASYSITHFKDHTPIKLVNIIADENQAEAKKPTRREKSSSMCFDSSKNKSSTMMFAFRIKNSKLESVLDSSEKIESWVNSNEKDSSKGISMGIVRNLLHYSEIMGDYKLKNDTRKLMWHPLLTYSVNRTMKRNGKYKDEEVGEFIERILKISKDEDEWSLVLELRPALCNAIFNLRK